MPDNKFDFDTPIDRKNTDSIKWNKYQGQNIFPVWVADMDFVSPKAVLKALHDRVDHGVFGYTHPPDELIRILIERMKNHYNWQVSAEWFVWLPGLVTGLNVCCRATGKEDDDVLTTTPIYPPFLSAPGFSSRQLITAPLKQSGDKWTFDFNKFEEAITERTRLFLLCSPYNPVGRVFAKEELLELSSICRKHDIVICSDEIHCDLILDSHKNHMPTASLNQDVEKQVITLMAPSKTYNLPGLGCSFAIIADPDLRHRFRKAMAGIVPHVNTLGYQAALAAYRDGDEWLAALISYLRGNRDIVMKTVNQIPGLKMTPVEATYLAWINARAMGLENPAAFFEQAGVGLSDGTEFGFPGYLRLNFACPRQELIRCLEKMDNAVMKLF
ncbi:MAG: PatB family C-S lyase [Proteobacteria bacterium]|nr:PatB family C-S lyase [Pseudomonadota bacterium]